MQSQTSLYLNTEMASTGKCFGVGKLSKHQFEETVTAGGSDWAAAGILSAQEYFVENVNIASEQ